MRYLEIADALRTAIGAGELDEAGHLPSEAALGQRFGASRVTVRRALETLRDEGVVTSRRGAGWFLAVDPVRQALGRFTTVEAALADAGVTPVREVLDFTYEPARGEVAGALALTDGEPVLRVRRRNSAGDEPFGVVTVWVPEHLAAPLSRADVEAHTFYTLLSRHGVHLGAATQTITAEAAGPDDTEALGVPQGAPMLVCRRVTRDVARRPVLVSEHRYPAHRTSFEVDFPRVLPGAGGDAAGLHLVASFPPTASAPSAPSSDAPGA